MHQNQEQTPTNPQNAGPNTALQRDKTEEVMSDQKQKSVLSLVQGVLDGFDTACVWVHKRRL
jgi:hypothetical protein